MVFLSRLCSIIIGYIHYVWVVSYSATPPPPPTPDLICKYHEYRTPLLVLGTQVHAAVCDEIRPPPPPPERSRGTITSWTTAPGGI